MNALRFLFPICVISALGACAHQSETPSSSASAAAPPPAPPPAAPAPANAGATTPPKAEALYLYFDANSAKLDPQAEKVADQAARLYREGNPHVMRVVGHTDATGDELYNLYLSARRAKAVKQALVARGIPAATLEMQAAGESDPITPGAKSTDPQDRRAVITWR